MSKTNSAYQIKTSSKGALWATSNFKRDNVTMKLLLNLEEAAQFIGSYLFTLYLGIDWWMFFAWLLAPDLSMIGYVVNTKVGAFTYNLVHHKGIAILTIIAGIYLASVNIQFAGWLLLGHSAMDRMFGYGLKYADNFKHTHLGMIGKNEK